MAEYLVIRLGSDPDALVNWIAVDGSGARRSPPVTGPLKEATADIGERNVIVLVPSADVLTTTVDIPVKGGAKLQAALPFALEEFLADDIDNLHFASGNRRQSGMLPVSVVNRDILDGWLERLAEAGITASSLVADSYGLARIPGTISMLVAEDQVTINDGADTELVMQGVSPGDALAAIGAFDDGTGEDDDDEAAADDGSMHLPRHVLVYCEPADEERYQHDWLAMRQELDSLDVKLLADGVMPRLAVTIATGVGVNLLQGPYGSKTDYSGMLRPWKYAAMLLLAFGVVGFGAKAADYMSTQRQLDSLQQQFLADYQQIVPGARLPTDPGPAIQSLMARAGGGQMSQVFLSALEHLSRAMQQNTTASIEAISFRAGVVDVRLSAPDVATLDSIQRAVEQSGQFSATIQSTDQDGDKVNSRIQIQAGRA